MRLRFRTSLLALVAGAALAGAAAAPAATTIDRTLRCTGAEQGGVAVFTLLASPTGQPDKKNGKLIVPPAGFRPDPSVSLVTGLDQELLTFSSLEAGYSVSQSGCTRTKAKVALAPRKLSLNTNAVGGDGKIFNWRCIDVPALLLRIHLVSDADGVPLIARIALVNARTKRPLAYLNWARSRLKAYATLSCTHI